VRGQQKIDSERAQSIQEALIREHYLKGEATGTWNQASEEAMRRYQADNGWQNKTVPDSRALIKLGLGPSKDHLLNPESAMTTVPDAPRAEPMPTASHTGPPTTDTAPTANQPDTSRPQ
jgi:Putative peptidoglycan binding domain